MVDCVVSGYRGGYRTFRVEEGVSTMVAGVLLASSVLALVVIVMTRALHRSIGRSVSELRQYECARAMLWPALALSGFHMYMFGAWHIGLTMLRFCMGVLRSAEMKVFSWSVYAAVQMALALYCAMSLRAIDPAKSRSTFVVELFWAAVFYVGCGFVSLLLTSLGDRSAEVFVCRLVGYVVVVAVMGFAIWVTLGGFGRWLKNVKRRMRDIAQGLNRRPVPVGI